MAAIAAALEGTGRAPNDPAPRSKSCRWRTQRAVPRIETSLAHATDRGEALHFQRSLLHCCMHALAAIATIFQREQLADVLEDAARARELSRETNRRRLE